MGRRTPKLTKLWLLLLLSGILCVITSCSSPASLTHADADMIADLQNWLSDEMKTEIVFSSCEPYHGDDTEVLPEADAYFCTAFTAGDICFERIYGLQYNYSKTFGWNLTGVVPVNQDEWKVSCAALVDSARIIRDLEGVSYYSSYSNGQLESRRVLSSKILSREYDASVGYDRINFQVVLNADNVHEVVHIECEYLLDETYHWQLFAQDMYLDTVNVQSGVSDEILLEGLCSLKFYRDEEDSTWWIGELNRLTYEIVSRKLDSDNSEEIIEISFRGEGTYMYITGIAKLDFRFSSGWYLYDIEMEEDSCETGMLIDSWVLTEDRLLDTLINDRPFTYESIDDFALTEDMLSDFHITDIKITENGKFQTAYFAYDVQVSEAVFHIEGYGKYELTDEGTLTVATWNDTVDDITYDLTGIWYACDVTEDYLAYHTLRMTDMGNGTLEGQLTVYGIDLSGRKEEPFSASCRVLGNITFGTQFELFVESWTRQSGDTEILMPEGKYDLFNNVLVNEHAYSDSCVFTKEEPSDRLSRSEISGQLEDGDIAETLKRLAELQKDSR